MSKDKANLFTSMQNKQKELRELLQQTGAVKKLVDQYAPDLSEHDIAYYFMHKGFPEWEICVHMCWDPAKLDAVAQAFIDMGWQLGEESKTYGTNKHFKLHHPDIPKNTLLAEITMIANYEGSKCRVVEEKIMKEQTIYKVECDPEAI